MDQNYFNNLLTTQYIHEINILEDIDNEIPEYIDENELEKPKNDSVNQLVTKKVVSGKKDAKIDLVILDESEKIEQQENQIEPVITDKKNLLEFDYLKQKYSEKEIHKFIEWFDQINTINNIAEEKVETKGKNVNSHLIDKFIESNPRIEPGNEENKNANDFSAASITEPAELFTETLAKIYIKQKAYHKALSAYEKLSLKYPEKSAYFAVQIKKIKEILNK